MWLWRIIFGLTMYLIEHTHAIFDAMKVATTFFNDLRAGRSCAWSSFVAPELEIVKEHWAQIGLNNERADISIPLHGIPMTATQMRSLGRAMTVFIAAHDGRYSLLLDLMSKPLLSHPNPYAMSLSLANAENEREIDRSNQGIENLSPEDEHILRAIAAGISEAFNSPGQAMEPDLSSVGIMSYPEKDASCDFEVDGFNHA
jgi:hypothetical protein